MTLMNLLLRQKMGACSDFERKKITFETTLHGTVVTTVVQATCDNGPPKEDFKWLIERDRAQLLRFGADVQLSIRERQSRRYQGFLLRQRFPVWRATGPCVHDRESKQSKQNE